MLTEASLGLELGFRSIIGGSVQTQVCIAGLCILWTFDTEEVAKDRILSKKTGTGAIYEHSPAQKSIELK